jgi:hypothetical protein
MFPPSITAAIAPARSRVLLAAAVTAALAGCVSGGWGMKSILPIRSEPCVLSPDVTAEDIIAHLNAHTSQMHGWSSSDVRIQVPGPGGIPMKLEAMLAVEHPRNFRLRAKSLMGDEADLGSNDERFWFWMRRSPDPYIFTARHDELHLVQERMPLPFQPHWLVEALGVVPLNAREFTLERHGTEAGKVHLVSDRLSPAGRPVRHIIVVDTCRGHIDEHSLYDERGRLIARATLERYKPCGNPGLALPHRIHLEWPETELKLALDMGAVQVNPHAPEQMWALPQIPNVYVFDMGQRLRNMRDTAELPRDERPGRAAVLEDRTAEAPPFANPRQEQSLDSPPWDATEPPWDGESHSRTVPVRERRSTWSLFGRD